jgi:hypothetical protein
MFWISLAKMLDWWQEALAIGNQLQPPRLLKAYLSVSIA